MNRLMYSFSLSLAKVSVTKDHDCGLPTVEVDFSGPAGWKSKDRQRQGHTQLCSSQMALLISLLLPQAI